MASYPVPPRPRRASLPATPQMYRAAEPARRYSSTARHPRWVLPSTARAAFPVAPVPGARRSSERPTFSPGQRNFGTCTQLFSPPRRLRHGQGDSGKLSRESSSSHPARSTASTAGKSSALALVAALVVAAAVAVVLTPPLAVPLAVASRRP